MPLHERRKKEIVADLLHELMRAYATIDELNNKVRWLKIKTKYKKITFREVINNFLNKKRSKK